MHVKNKEGNLEEISKQIKGLEDKLERIEKKMSNNSTEKVEYHIQIDQLDIHQPVLDELTYRLDKLDIKELSGALNLGNNFTPKVESQRKSQSKAKKKEKLKEKNMGLKKEKKRKSDVQINSQKGETNFEKNEQYSIKKSGNRFSFRLKNKEDD